MGDRVFIADYIKKKRRRKGSQEYLVKWKDYSSRHCTWEPEDNILDKSLITQFTEEGYDPYDYRRRVRTKKRRRSEITETRPLSNRLLYLDSESDQDDKGYSHDRLQKKYKDPVTISDYGSLWRPAVARSRAGDTLSDDTFEHTTKQKRVGEGSNDDCFDKENVLNRGNTASPVDSVQQPNHINGGKSCHPKMRAKFMFRTGEFGDCDWGYDWSSSDTESVRETKIADEMRKRTDTENSQSLKRKRSEFENEKDYNDDNSNHSECSTIPAIDTLTDDKRAIWNTQTDNFVTHSKTTEFTPPDVDFTTTSFTEKSDDIHERLMDFDWETEQNSENKKNADDNVIVTEVMHDYVTVIFVESPIQNGFFKCRGNT